MKKRMCLSLLLTFSLLVSMVPGALAVTAPTVTAKGAIVIEYDTGEVYYEKNADVARPAASMSKLMSLYLVYDEIDAGRLSLTDTIPASQSAAAISNNSRYSGFEKLVEGQQYQVEQLMELIVTASCNGSLVALADYIAGSEAAFVTRMNQTAADWGINAQFADCTGFIDEGNAVSPRAMAEIGRRIMRDHPDILRLTAMKSTTFEGKTYTTTNKMLRDGSYLGIDGLKSGTTNGSGPCYIGTAKRDGRRIISVAMNATSNTTRVSDTRTLLDYGFASQPGFAEVCNRIAKDGVMDFSSTTPTLYPETTASFQVTLSNLEQSVSAVAQWEINGSPVAGFRNDAFQAENGKVSSLSYPISADMTQITVGLRLTLFNGAVLYREATFPIAAATAKTFRGQMGITQVSVYPGTTLSVPCQITCEQSSSCTVPAGWYLDDTLIPGYYNAAFSIRPLGKSVYTFLVPETMSVGTHTLRFICNPNGQAGATRTEFTTVIEVLPSAAA